MFSCGVTDGAASRIDMVNRAGNKVSIFVHDILPENLTGNVPITGSYYVASSAKLDYCRANATGCSTAMDGAITILVNSNKSITGNVHFTVDGSTWGDIKFALKIVDPPHLTICG